MPPRLAREFPFPEATSSCMADHGSREGRNRKEENKFMSAKTSRNHPRTNPLRLLAGLLVTGLSVTALLGQSVPFPTYKVGPQTNGTFVASDGTILTQA